MAGWGKGTIGYPGCGSGFGSATVGGRSMGGTCIGACTAIGWKYEGWWKMTGSNVIGFFSSSSSSKYSLQPQVVDIGAMFTVRCGTVNSRDSDSQV